MVKQMLGLIAVEQTRGRTKFYKMKGTGPFAPVLKQVHTIGRLADNNSKVDRMWERLVEIGMYLRTRSHRRPAEVLQAFIAGTNQSGVLSKNQIKQLRDVFGFLKSAYSAHPNLKASSLATDQPQFYTLVTTLLESPLLTRFNNRDLGRKLARVAEAISRSTQIASISKKKLDTYTDLSTKATADPGRRKDRSKLLVEMIEAA